MSDSSTDVRARLATLLDEGGEHARRRETAAALAAADTVASLAESEVSGEELSRRLVHGCARVRATAADEPLVAAEYFDSMAALVADEGTGG